MGRTARGLVFVGAVLVIGGGLGLGWLYWERAGPEADVATAPADSDTGPTGEADQAPESGDSPEPSETPDSAESGEAPASAQHSEETAESSVDGDVAPAAQDSPRADDGRGDEQAVAMPRRVPGGADEQDDTAPGRASGEGADQPSLIVPGPQPPADGSEPHRQQLAGPGKAERTPESGDAEPPADSGDPASAARADTAEAPEPAPAGPAQTPESGPAEAEREGPRQPVFDVVRVDPSGQAVIAGRASPRARVIVESPGGEALGTTRADETGEFVVILQGPLDPGAHAFSLRAETQDGSQPSDQAVVAVIPPPGRGVAEQALLRPLPVPEASGGAAEPAATAARAGETGSETDRRPLVMLVPREESEATASNIVQRPALPSAGSGDGAGEGDRSDPGRLEPLGPIPGAGAVPPPAAVPEGPSSPDESVRVDIIEYGEDVPLDVRGEATPGANVEAFLEGEKIGEDQADRRGEWRVTTDRPVPPGNYRLRVDRLAPGGEVAARLVMPFQRAEPPSPDTRNDFIIVQPGHNLWRIARRVYGSGVRYTQIYEANRSRIQNPDLIYPGQVFQLPRDTGDGDGAGRVVGR